MFLDFVLSIALTGGLSNPSRLNMINNFVVDDTQMSYGEKMFVRRSVENQRLSEPARRLLY